MAFFTYDSLSPFKKVSLVYTPTTLPLLALEVLFSAFLFIFGLPACVPMCVRTFRLCFNFFLYPSYSFLPQPASPLVLPPPPPPVPFADRLIPDVAPPPLSSQQSELLLPPLVSPPPPPANSYSVI